MGGDNVHRLYFFLALIANTYAPYIPPPVPVPLDTLTNVHRVEELRKWFLKPNPPPPPPQLDMAADSRNSRLVISGRHVADLPPRGATNKVIHGFITKALLDDTPRCIWTLCTAAGLEFEQLAQPPYLRVSTA